MAKPGFVYIMANRRNGTIYVGATSDLGKRAWQHRNGVINGFTQERGCKLLVWYEAHETIEAARRRELQMKEWKRNWKLRELEGLNPEWEDLYDRIANQ